mmetsp:Transcript_50695/g.147552  ORF Transcript_50695/g.147552 Transcript_50695/m.147552 type:complete len:174 (-) Transcript_50695:116-637(-)
MADLELEFHEMQLFATALVQLEDPRFCRCLPNVPRRLPPALLEQLEQLKRTPGFAHCLEAEADQPPAVTPQRSRGRLGDGSGARRRRPSDGAPPQQASCMPQKHLRGAAAEGQARDLEAPQTSGLCHSTSSESAPGTPTVSPCLMLATTPGCCAQPPLRAGPVMVGVSSRGPR